MERRNHESGESVVRLIFLLCLFPFFGVVVEVVHILRAGENASAWVENLEKPLYSGGIFKTSSYQMVMSAQAITVDRQIAS